MWNYPFDPEEIEGEDRESTFGEAVWYALLGMLAIASFLIFGGHALAFILN